MASSPETRKDVIELLVLPEARQIGLTMGDNSLILVTSAIARPAVAELFAIAVVYSFDFLSPTRHAAAQVPVSSLLRHISAPCIRQVSVGSCA